MKKKEPGNPGTFRWWHRSVIQGTQRAKGWHQSPARVLQRYPWLLQSNLEGEPPWKDRSINSWRGKAWKNRNRSHVRYSDLRTQEIKYIISSMGLVYFIYSLYMKIAYFLWFLFYLSQYTYLFKMDNVEFIFHTPGIHCFWDLNGYFGMIWAHSRTSWLFKHRSPISPSLRIPSRLTLLQYNYPPKTNIGPENHPLNL